MPAIIRNIVNQAYQLPGIYAADEVADGTDTALAVIKLNELIGQLNTDQLFPFARKIVSHTFTESKEKYTIGLDIGSTADIVEERPIFINRILFYPNTTAMPIACQQMDISDLLSRQLSQGSTGLPMYFAVNPTFPLAEIYFDIKPSTSYTMRMVYNKSIDDVTINSTLDIPREYNELLITGLARKLCVLKQVDEANTSLVSQLYKEAYDRVKSTNERNQLPLVDPLYGDSSGNMLSFNAWTNGGW